MSPETSHYSNFCSGILINSSHILTAAHCFRDDTDIVEVKCSTEETSISVERDDVHISPYFNDVKIENTQYPRSDLALITLKEEVPSKRVEVIDLSDVSDDSRCAFFGFSQLRSKSKDKNFPYSKGWYVNAKSLDNFFSYQNMIRLKGLLAPGGLSQIGDSGGPLMCKQNNEWKLLGIASSRDFNYNSVFTAVNESRLYDDAQNAPVRRVHEAQLQLEEIRRNSVKVELSLLKNKIDDLKTDLKKMEIEVSLEDEADELNEISISLEASDDLNAIIKEMRLIKRKTLLKLFDISNIALGVKPFTKFIILKDGSEGSTGDLNYNYALIKNVDLRKNKVLIDLRTLGISDYFNCSGEIICDSQIVTEVEISLDDFKLEIFKNIFSDVSM